VNSVFFIGGTSYSGSTFFDMTLANDPHGFSCGEVHALFRPYRDHHHNSTCGCGDKDCDIWPRVREEGEDRLYDSLFKHLPSVDFAVDSSKAPLWIDHQARLCRKRGLDVRHVLIWKTPAEMAASCEKRGHGKLWAKKWIAYHRLYLSLIDNFVALPYRALATEPGALEAVCRYLGIGYFDNKHEYWNKNHHTLFGNTSAKIHTREREAAQYAAESEHLKRRAGRSGDELSSAHRSIHYEPHESGGSPVKAQKERHSATIGAILRILKSRDVRSSKPGANSGGADIADIQASILEIRVRRAMDCRVVRNLRRLMGGRRSD
jgi:hypothetical protein